MRNRWHLWLTGLGILLLLVLNLVSDDAFLDPGSVLIATLGVALTPLAMRRPMVAAALYCALFLLTMWQTDWRSFLNLAWGAVIVGCISFQRPWYFALVPTALMFLVSSIDTDNGDDFDFFSAIIFALLYGIGIAIGSIARRIQQKHNAEREAYRNRMRDQRDALMTTLHDSVSKSLTSVVMRSEGLALQLPEGHKAADTAVDIANDARQAMSEVRDLLRVMKLESPRADSHKPRSLKFELEETAEFIRSHDFGVDLLMDVGRGIGKLKLPHELHLVLVELSANIIKYSEVNSTVLIEVQQKRRGVYIELRSQNARRQSNKTLTTGLGLEEMAHRVEELHGWMEGGPEGQQWVTKLWLPTSSLLDL